MGDQPGDRCKAWRSAKVAFVRAHSATAGLAMSMTRGRLRIYLGAAPGVGKTYAALDEARRLAGQGVDVVLGFVETYLRPETVAMAAGLESIPPELTTGRPEPDIVRILDRHPQVVVIDELAHADGTGRRRWEGVARILDSGIDVITTLNIQHLESLRDVVAEITGVVEQDVIPDELVRSADEIELVDLTQEALRERLAAGRVYPPDRLDHAQANLFQPASLSALRELALSWTADRVDEVLERLRRDQGIDQLWETRERVVVGITGAEGGDETIRRAARVAMRARGQLLGVHVQVHHRPDSAATRFLDDQRQLIMDLGGDYHQMRGPDVAEAIVEFAASHHATQLVVGASRRNRWDRLLRGSVIEDILRRAGPIDVHVISGSGSAGTPRFPRPQVPSLPSRRILLGWIAAAAGFALTTPVMLARRDSIELQNVLLTYLLVTVVAAWVGGLAPALATGVVGFLLANYLFTPPYHTWAIHSGADVLALAAFTIIAGTMGALVSLTARRANQILQTRAEAETLLSLASAAATDDPQQIITRLHRALTERSISLLRPDATGWTRVVGVGTDPPSSLERSDRIIELSQDVLAVRGSPLTGAEERLLQAFTAQLSAVLHREQLAREAAERHALAQADILRTALLRAVSHDLRSPLAAIQASVSGLLQDDIDWAPDQVRALLGSTYSEVVRLDHLVADLLDASRIQARAVKPHLTRVGLEEIVAAALTGIDRSARHRFRVNVPESLPTIITDPALLERVIENLLRNALVHHPDDSPITIDAGTVGTVRVDLRVIDHGPGIPVHERTRLFEPFQQLDQAGTVGVGLGLSVAKGLAEALGHRLNVDDTVGGGTTMTISMSTEPQ